MRFGWVSLASIVVLAGGVGTSLKAVAEDGRVRLTQPPPIRAKVMALPRIAAPDAVGIRINDEFNMQDADVKKEIKQCRSSDPRRWFWERQVQVMMKGPAYLSIFVKDSSSCGGPYPPSEEYALVYDLRSGMLVSWSMLLPGVNVAGDRKAPPTGIQGEAVSSIALTKIYLRERKFTLTGADWEKDCTEALSSTELSFLVWPDGDDGALHIKPADLPHVLQACGATVSLGDGQMRELGLSEEMREAIKTAHSLSAK
jgi:hypothetical protein